MAKLVVLSQQRHLEREERSEAARERELPTINGCGFAGCPMVSLPAKPPQGGAVIERRETRR
jgi:hypothetical protein